MDWYELNADLCLQTLQCLLGGLRVENKTVSQFEPIARDGYEKGSHDPSIQIIIFLNPSSAARGVPRGAELPECV